MNKSTSDPVFIARDLAREASALRFGPPVAYVYNPLGYAWELHRRYLSRYGRGRREVLLVGMNPGPWGMAQTGVPFGEVGLVRAWLGLKAEVGRPEREHPKRLVRGLSCPRSEVSGARLWGWARSAFGTPEAFFSRFFVLNYCPLLFLERSGRNLTPDKLRARERAALDAACGRALRRLADYYRPKAVIGVGLYARDRAREALAGLDLSVGSIPHPSPASPAANRGWAKAAEAALREQGAL